MDFSVYATCYNNADILRKSLDSIVTQFDLNGSTELVVVDNYSTDGTFEILNEYSAKFRNVKILRERCTRGKGRQIAFINTSGKFVFHIDLDTTYPPFLSYLIRRMSEEYVTGAIMPLGFSDRATMEKLGGWMDLNYAEDCELLARAISKGIKLFEIPAIVGENEPGKGGTRENRYASGTIKRMKRYYGVLEATIRGNGLNLKRILADYKGKVKVALILTYFVTKLKRKHIFIYSATGWNWDIVKRETTFLDPLNFGIPRERWFVNIQPMLSEDEKATMIEKLLKIGLDQRILFKDGRIFVFTEETSKELLERQKSIWGE